jgi:hypothetical protein
MNKKFNTGDVVTKKGEKQKMTVDYYKEVGEPHNPHLRFVTDLVCLVFFNVNNQLRRTIIHQDNLIICPKNQ